MSSGEKPTIDPSVFRDKIVFVGTSADGLFDVWSTPFGGGGMPGAQLHAALADDVLSNRFMRRASPMTDALATISAGLAAGALATVLPVAWAGSFFRHKGRLEKFAGDMVRGLFGAPVPDPRHADHAVGAAVEMASVLARLNRQWTAAGMPTLDIGIGINSGEMIAGNIG